MGVANGHIHVDSRKWLHDWLHIDRELCRSSSQDTM